MLRQPAQLEPPRHAGLTSAFVLFLTGVLALWWGMVGIERIDAALRDGYVLVTGGGGTRSPEIAWFYPYHAASHPFEFHAALIPWVFGPLWLLSLGVAQAILIAATVVGGGGARPSGALKWMLWVTLALLGSASMALLFYLQAPLKPPPGQACIRWDPRAYSNISYAPGSPCHVPLK